MGSYQRKRSRSTAGIEPHIRQLKAYKQENVRERERAREREMGKTITLDYRSKYYNIPLALSLFCPC